jgi:hypothetical protein
VTEEREKWITEHLEYNPITGIVSWTTEGSHKRGPKGSEAGFYNKIERYRLITCSGRILRTHRIVWYLYYNQWPKYVIDHIDGNTTNNRIENLRDVTRKTNSRNMKRSKANKSGVTGVFWCKRVEKWGASIYQNRRNVALGNFTQKWDAICARKSAEVRFGYHENHGRA